MFASGESLTSLLYFVSGYKPVIMARRIVEESPLSSPGGSYSALRNCEKFNNYVDNFKSPNVPSPMALPTAVYQPSPVPEELGFGVQINDILEIRKLIILHKELPREYWLLYQRYS